MNFHVIAGTPTRHRGTRSNRQFSREIGGQGFQSTAERAAAAAAGTGSREARGTGTTGTVTGSANSEISGTPMASAVSTSFGMAVSHRNSRVSHKQ